MEPTGLMDRFKEKASAVQAVVCPIATITAACTYAVNLTKEQGGTAIAVAGFQPDVVAILKECAAKENISVMEGPFPKTSVDFHTAFTPSNWGIAETGTLVLKSESEDLRIATMLCETHVCILDPATLLPSTEELEPEIDAYLKGNTAYLAFITGASRTADIERILSIGVHGPEHLHILIQEVAK